MNSVERQQELALAPRIASRDAHDRVAALLYEIVVDGSQFGPCDLPQAEDREWLLGAMAVPIQAAADAALDSLSRSMTRAVASGPNGLLARLQQSHCGKEFGRQ